jgi:tetratricopeptide (TPR) repeat protein
MAEASRDASEKAGLLADERRAIASRSRAPAAAQPFASDESNIVVTGSRVATPRRGDWNACTVDDPGRSLDACRKRLGRAAKGDAAAHLAAGLGHAWGGDTDEAIADFDRAIASAPGSAFAYLNRGLAWRRSGNLDRALADLDRAVKYGPGEARNYYGRSQILRQQGATGRARRDEERAIELDPAYAQVVR